MPKRGQNEGTIVQRRDGRWEARLTLPDGRRKSFYAPTKTAAMHKLNAAKRDVAADELPAVEDVTVEAFLRRWLDDVIRPRLRESSYRNYDQFVRLFYVPAFGTKKLARLTTADIQRMLAEAAERLSPATVVTARDRIVGALDVAVEWRLVPRNVARATKAPRVVRRRTPVITPDDARAFLKNLKGDSHEAIFTVALAMGLRLSEALGLRWQDVDLEQRTLRVANQMTYPRHRAPELGPLKTPSARRTLPLPQPVRDALVAHKAKQDALRARLGDGWRDLDLVFPGEEGQPRWPSALRRSFYFRRRGTALEKLRFHDLRHCAASLLIAQGVPLPVVAAVLGHSSPKITMQVYAHVVPGALESAAASMEKALAAD